MNQLSAVGITYDLRLFLPEGATAAITWVPAKPRAFRSITFGTYDPKHHLIRINRLLDHPAVPATFLSFLVYHEHLHAVLPPHYDASGRRRAHHRAFRQAEALHPHFHEAKRWERHALLKLKRIHRGWS